MSNSLADFASHVGPHLDRLRLGVMRLSLELGMKSGAVEGSGLTPETIAVFAMLRNAYPDRPVPVRSFRAAYVYQDPARFEDALSMIVETGLVTLDPDRSVTLSTSGRALVSRVRQTGAQAAETLWGSGRLPVLALADRCLTAAATTAEPEGAFHLVAPPHDEAGDSDASLLAERLTGLRWHRFDAHVAAWTAAGFTAASVATLDPGPVRDAIEASTNERAGEAYAPLTRDERSSFLDSLGRLPAEPSF